MNYNLENYFITLFVTIIFLAGLIGIFSLANGCGLFAFIKSIWDYFFNKWEITIKEEGEETWQRQPQYTWQELIDYNRDYVIYLYKNKYSKEEKLVKKYLN